MAEVPSLLADPLATNPIFSDRKLKLGTFCTNLKHGCAASTIEGTLEASWPATVALAELADRMEYEALVPVGRWRGFGGTTDFNGEGFECYSWAAGIAGVNRNSGIFATSHVPTVHPVMAAKQAATIDHISGGRFILNVVTGWNEPEFRLFGIDVPDHDRRYDMATEWVEIIRRLWTEDELFDFEGEFYRIGGGQLLPKPIQKPRPPFMNAGGSERGRHFAAKYCDVAFIVVARAPGRAAVCRRGGSASARRARGRGHRAARPPASGSRRCGVQHPRARSDASRNDVVHVAPAPGRAKTRPFRLRSARLRS